MKWAVLITWVITAGGGFVLLSIWLRRGGMRQQQDAGNRIRPPLILSHFLLAAAGLVVWIVYLAVDKDALAWIAFAILAVVAALGWPMVAIWLRRREGAAGASSSTSSAKARRRSRSTSRGRRSTSSPESRSVRGRSYPSSKTRSPTSSATSTSASQAATTRSSPASWATAARPRGCGPS